MTNDINPDPKHGSIVARCTLALNPHRWVINCRVTDYSAPTIRGPRGSARTGQVLKNELVIGSARFALVLVRPRHNPSPLSVPILKNPARDVTGANLRDEAGGERIRFNLNWNNQLYLERFIAIYGCSGCPSREVYVQLRIGTSNISIPREGAT